MKSGVRVIVSACGHYYQYIHITAHAAPARIRQLGTNCGHTLVAVVRVRPKPGTSPSLRLKDCFR